MTKEVSESDIRLPHVSDWDLNLNNTSIEIWKWHRTTEIGDQYVSIVLQIKELPIASVSLCH